MNFVESARNEIKSSLEKFNLKHQEELTEKSEVGTNDTSNKPTKGTDSYMPKDSVMYGDKLNNDQINFRQPKERMI